MGSSKKLNIERPTVNQRYLNELDKPADMPDIPWVQWRVENMEEIHRFLEDFEVRIMLAPGNHLLVQGAWTNMNLQLSPGDCLVLMPASAERPQEQLGVIYSKAAIAHREGEYKEGQQRIRH